MSNDNDEDVICMDCMWDGTWDDTVEYHCPVCGSDQVVTIKELRGDYDA